MIHSDIRRLVWLAGPSRFFLFLVAVGVLAALDGCAAAPGVTSSVANVAPSPADATLSVVNVSPSPTAVTLSRLYVATRVPVDTDVLPTRLSFATRSRTAVSPTAGTAESRPRPDTTAVGISKGSLTASATNPAPTSRAQTATMNPARASRTRAAPQTGTPSRVLDTRAAPTRVSSVRVYESMATFDAYPYENFLSPRHDPDNNFLFYALDRHAYAKSIDAQGVQPRLFRTLVLENEFLKLTFLPELGGRLLQMTYKPSGQDLFYNNRVLKPSPWGPQQQGGWMAIGGMEWALPVSEHGYEWGTPWDFEIVQHTDGASLTWSDTRAHDRVRAQIRVTLPAHAAYIVVHPRVENPTPHAQRLQFWLNAQLSLGARNVSPTTEFIFPTDAVFVHSTGNAFIPEAHVPPDETAPAAPISFSNVGGRDLRRYANWDDYLGVFAAELGKDFVGAYNYDTALGIVRVFPPAQAPGVKLFAFGPRFCCRHAFTDDASDYFEIWGGLPRTFFHDDDVTLLAGETREWDEYWIPFANTGGLTAASRDVVVHLAGDEAGVALAVYSAIPRRVTVILLQNENEIGRWAVSLMPGKVFRERVNIEPVALQLQVLDSSGRLVVQVKR